MSRLIQEDFCKLCDFIKSYRIEGIIVNEEAKTILSTYHKKYFAYLILIEELHQHINDTTFDNYLSTPQYDFLQESCSDVGQAFFLLFHGCYKGAKLLLRSSIENYLKAIGMDENPKLPTTKSVYEVFDVTKTTKAFRGNKEKLHSQLRDEYVNLCQDVHTADKMHMSSISALSHFPCILINEASAITKMVQRLVSIYVTIIALKYNQIYHLQNFNHKEICNKAIIKEFKKEVHNIE